MQVGKNVFGWFSRSFSRYSSTMRPCATTVVLSGGSRYRTRLVWWGECFVWRNTCVLGPYWGPSNTGGQCDSIMNGYCKSARGRNDELCACLNSDIPNPECTDQRCRLTNAMKLSNMLNNTCSGNFITCQQFFNLSEDALNNLVDRNTIQQTCTQIVTSSNPAGKIDLPSNLKDLLPHSGST